jgi:preprotein translocase subunit SecG
MDGVLMETLLLIISILLIAIVLLQSNKASDSAQIITGGNESLFQNSKERGIELLISRITLILGIVLSYFHILSA